MHYRKQLAIWITAICSVAMVSGCTANGAPVIRKSTGKLISYFDAKNELASTLEQTLGGQPSEQGLQKGRSQYRLVAINGPSYPVGAVIPLDNLLDLETRDCIIDKSRLPEPEVWGSFPSWTSGSKLDLGLSVPSLISDAFAKARVSADVGLSFGRNSDFEMKGLSQIFLSRNEVSRSLDAPRCRAAINEIGTRPALFVRGIVYGQETLRSARSFDGNLDIQSIASPDGDFQLRFDNSGAFELSEDKVKPKFAILAKIDPQRLAIYNEARIDDYEAGKRNNDRLAGVLGVLKSPTISDVLIAPSDTEIQQFRALR